MFKFIKTIVAGLILSKTLPIYAQNLNQIYKKAAIDEVRRFQKDELKIYNSINNIAHGVQVTGNLRHCSSLYVNSNLTFSIPSGLTSYADLNGWTYIGGPFYIFYDIEARKKRLVTMLQGRMLDSAILTVNDQRPELTLNINELSFEINNADNGNCFDIVTNITFVEKEYLNNNYLAFAENTGSRPNYAGDGPEYQKDAFAYTVSCEEPKIALAQTLRHFTLEYLLNYNTFSLIHSIQFYTKTELPLSFEAYQRDVGFNVSEATKETYRSCPAYGVHEIGSGVPHRRRGDLFNPVSSFL